MVLSPNTPSPQRVLAEVIPIAAAAGTPLSLAEAEALIRRMEGLRVGPGRTGWPDRSDGIVVPSVTNTRARPHAEGGPTRRRSADLGTRGLRPLRRGAACVAPSDNLRRAPVSWSALKWRIGAGPVGLFPGNNPAAPPNRLPFPGVARSAAVSRAVEPLMKPSPKSRRSTRTATSTSSSKRPRAAITNTPMTRSSACSASRR